MKIRKVEKVMLAMVDIDKYTTFHCISHGLFQERKDTITEKCPYCKQRCSEVENVAELKEKYSKELGVN